MKHIFTMLGLFFSINCFAYDGWSGANKIASVRVYSNSVVLITMPRANNPKGCSNPSYLALKNIDTESGRRLYSAILAAYMSGKTVDLALTGCSGDGQSGYAVIEQVWLK